MEGREPVPPPSPGWTQPPTHNPFAEMVGVMKSALWSAGFIAFITMLVLSFAIVLAMTPDIQQWVTTPVPSESDPAILVLPRDYIFIITPWYLPLFSMSGPGFQAWHFLMLGILALAFARAKYDMFRSWLSGRGAAARSLLVPEKATSSMEGVAKLFMASISFSLAYFIFLYLINVEMHTPDFARFSTPELIYRLFGASVFEELVARVLLLGLPLAALGVLRGSEKPARSILGGGSGLNPVTLVLIAFSAGMFAFAHVGSWDLWKVPQVLVTGMALGWAFVRYGLHASILIHFSINLSSSATEIWPESAMVEMLFGFAILIWMIAGGYFFLHYCIELVMKLFPGIRPKPVRATHVPPPPHWQRSYQQYQGQQPPRAPDPPPPPEHWQQHGTVPPPPWAYGQPQAQPQPEPRREISPGMVAGFVCPGCGHTSAKYDSGRLTCLRCGAAHYRDQPAENPEEKKLVEF